MTVIGIKCKFFFCDFFQCLAGNVPYFVRDTVQSLDDSYILKQLNM